MQRRNVRVIERREYFRFTLEAPDAVGVERKRFWQNLDRAALALGFQKR